MASAVGSHRPSTIARGAWRLRRIANRAGLTAALAAAVLASGARPAAAADPSPAGTAPADPGPASSPNLLDRPRADVALLPPGGPDGAPRLLALDPPAAGASSLRLSILERDGAWSEVAALDVTLDLPPAAIGIPWLVGLGGDRFVVVATARDLVRTRLVRVDVVAADRGPEIVERGATTLELLVEDTGAADIRADGSTDLVVSTADLRSTDSACRGSTLRVFADGALATPPVMIGSLAMLDAGVIGAFDDVPGDDLAIYSQPSCADAAGAPSLVDLHVIRLADGATITEQRALRAGLPTWLAPPVRIDVDSDGRSELLARIDRGLAVLDPTDGWSAHLLSPGGAIPLGALRPRAGRSGGEDPGAVGVVWLEPSVDGPGTLGVAHVHRRTGGTLELATAAVRSDSVPASSRWQLAVAATQTSGVRPVAWSGAVLDAGCRDLVVPTAIVSCASGELSGGPMWVGSRPLAGIDDRGGARVLVAAGADRDGGRNAPLTPDPWADGGSGRWRHGPATRFALAEVPLAALRGPQRVARPVVDPTASVGPAATITARQGTRLLVAAVGLGPKVPPAQADLDPLAAVLERPPGSPPVELVRLPVSPAAASGGEFRSSQFPLDAVDWSGELSAVSWSMTIIPVSDVGDVSAAYVVTIRRDVDPPALRVDAPTLTPIWPVAATLSGTTEPGATVRLDGGPPTTADDGGSFSIQAALAPWPQTVRVESSDAFGNTRRFELELVGGVDYRTFPWAAILAGAVIVAVAISGVVGSRRRQGGGGSVDGPGNAGIDAAGVPVLEELPPGTGL